SLMQIVFGVKSQFGRTPKIDHRTSIPLTCTAAILALFGWSVSISYADYVRGDGLHAIFAFSNVLALGYGIVALIGLRAIGEDFGNAVSSTAVALVRKVVPSFGKRPVEDVPAVDIPALRRFASELAPSIQASDPAYLAPVIGRFSGRPLTP